MERMPRMRYGARMKWLQRAMAPGLACLLAGASLAEEPTTIPAADQTPARMLTLGSPMIRSTMDRVKLAWLFPAQMPEFRLKMERPAEIPLSPEEWQGQLRGVEIRLPMEGLWVGYVMPAEGEEPRATFSIQRGF